MKNIFFVGMLCAFSSNLLGLVNSNIEGGAFERRQAEKINAEREAQERNDDREEQEPLNFDQVNARMREIDRERVSLTVRSQRIMQQVQALNDELDTIRTRSSSLTDEYGLLQQMLNAQN